ncbi:MAG: SpoIIIAH-like family protein [Clostridia bacterium]|nr:SpoIIIAH-like family protein [Clostridia bacterium]
MMVLKRKEIMAAALVVLIGVAGYLNWSYQDTIKVTDGDSYIETGKKLGEAQYVNAPAENEENSTEQNYFSEAKLQKENARSKALEILKQTAENQGFDNEIRLKAQNEILQIADNTEKETAVENIAKAKGYSDICVYISEGSVNIAVKKNGLSENDIAKIQEIAMSQLNIPAKNIKIVEVK